MKNMKSGGFFRLFLLTYVAVLCLPVLTWIVANRSYYEALTERELETNRAQLGQAQMVIDQQFLTLDQLARHASNSLVIQRALRITPPVRTAENIAYKDAVDSIFNMNVAYTGIDHLYIYMANTDAVLYHSGKYTKDVFYEAYLASANFSRGQWEELLVGEGARLIPCVVGERAKILYVCDIVPPGGVNALGRLIVQLDTARIEQMLPGARDGYSALLTAAGEPLFERGDAAVWGAIRDQVAVTGLGYEIIADGERVLVETRASETGYLGYISATNASSLQKEINSLLYTLLWILAASVAMAFVTSVLFARRMAGPLARAASALELPGGSRALNRLSDAALEMVSSNREIMRALDAQRPMAKNNLLLKLLQGETRITEDSMRDSFGLAFPHEYFCCIRAEGVDEREDAGETVGEAAAPRDILLASALLQHELGGFGAVETVVHSYNVLLLLLNRADDNVSMDELAAACDRARRQTVSAGGYTLHIALGTWRKGVEGISGTYFEAVNAERSRFAVGSDAVCVYTGESVKTAYFFPGTWKKRLATTVMAGDAQQANAIIEALLAENGEKSISATAMKSLFLDICSTLLSGFLDDAEGPEQDEIMRLMDAVITGAAQADEAVSRIHAVIYALCRARQESRRTSRDALRERILRAIDARYADANITVSALAREIGLNPSYLSHSFKELMGDTIMDYINKKRIARAKELMRNDELTLLSIAEQVGYVNDTVFIRHFKKQEGITPGRYRQIGLP